MCIRMCAHMCTATAGNEATLPSGRVWTRPGHVKQNMSACKCGMNVQRKQNHPKWFRYTTHAKPRAKSNQTPTNMNRTLSKNEGWIRRKEM